MVIELQFQHLKLRKKETFSKLNVSTTSHSLNVNLLRIYPLNEFSISIRQIQLNNKKKKKGTILKIE